VKKFIFLTREGNAARSGADGCRRADRRGFESNKYHTDKKEREIQSVALAGFDSGLWPNLPLPSTMAASSPNRRILLAT